MMSPFDSKNRVATALDRLALRVLLFFLSVGYFFALWHSGAPSLLAGSALFALAMLTLLLLERRTLARRDRALRVRVGGAIALEELMLLPAAEAEERVCLLLAETLGGAAQGSVLSYAGKTYLVRCAQTLPGSAAGRATCSPPTGRRPLPALNSVFWPERAAFPPPPSAPPSGWSRPSA